jgi:hypothetical protein
MGEGDFFSNLLAFGNTERMVGKKLDRLDARKLRCEFCDAVKVFVTVVAIRNNGATQDDFSSDFVERGEICENPRIVHPDKLLVSRGIGFLAVKEKAIDERRGLEQIFCSCKPRGFDAGRIAFFLATLQELVERIKLRKRLSARKGDSSAVREKDIVLGELLHDLVDRIFFAKKLECSYGARVGAFAAKRAFGSVDGMLTVGKGMNARRADGGALLTADAFVPQKGKLTFLRFAFGVMTPDTVQRTAFEKDDRADALAIVERKMLDIENMRGVH